MSLLSALLPLTLALNPSYPSSYHQPLLLPFSVILTAVTHLGTLKPWKTNQAKTCLLTPNTYTYTISLRPSPSHSNSLPHALAMTSSLRNTTATSHLSSLPYSDITA